MDDGGETPDRATAVTTPPPPAAHTAPTATGQRIAVVHSRSRCTVDRTARTVVFRVALRRVQMIARGQAPPVGRPPRRRRISVTSYDRQVGLLAAEERAYTITVPKQSWNTSRTAAEPPSSGTQGVVARSPTGPGNQVPTRQAACISVFLPVPTHMVLQLSPAPVDSSRSFPRRDARKFGTDGLRVQADPFSSGSHEGDRRMTCSSPTPSLPQQHRARDRVPLRRRSRSWKSSANVASLQTARSRRPWRRRSHGAGIPSATSPAPGGPRGADQQAPSRTGCDHRQRARPLRVVHDRRSAPVWFGALFMLLAWR